LRNEFAVISNQRNYRDYPTIPVESTLGAIDAPSQPTLYSYDILNNLKTVNQGQQTRTFSYDSLSRLKTATYPEMGTTPTNGTISYQYDNNGNLTQKTDARNVVTTYVYDALNRVTNRNYTPVTSSANYQMTPNVTYIYDGAGATIPFSKGKLTEVDNGISKTKYTAFDVMGRVTGSEQITPGAVIGAQTYSYNLSGALIEEKYPSGRVVKNVLDSDGDLEMVQSKKNTNAGYWNYAKSFSYTAAGAVSSMQLGNGKWESTIFNSRLQPTQIALGTVQNGTDKLKLNFGYGSTQNNGNVLSQTITVPTETRDTITYAAFTATQAYTYDSLNRLKDAKENIDNQTTPNWKQTFKYDRYGNRNFDTTNSTDTTTPDSSCAVAVCNPAVDPATNKLIGYGFDNAGNTITDAVGKTFTYDAENKQVKVMSGTTVKGEYFYDGDGKRVKKVAGMETTIFVYNASGKMVAEYSTIVASPAEAKVSYLTADHLGSPRINTDANGATISRHDYMPFGEEVVRAGYGGDTVRKQFTSYERDNESELDFAQARYYSSKLGRFYSVDPENVGATEDDPQSWNAYAYSRNNPVLFTDPDGEKWKVCDGQGNCTEISDADAKNTLFNRKGNHSEIKREDGKIFDENGNPAGTYERISFDDFDDRQNDLFFGSGRLIESSRIRMPIYELFGGIIGLFSGPVGAGGEVLGVLSQGNKVINHIDDAINVITATGTVIKNSKSKIIEKATAGIAEATKDFNQLAKLGGNVVTKGKTKIVELKNGFKAILRPSSDGRLTLEIQRKTKEIGSGAGKNIEIRYGTK